MRLTADDLYDLKVIDKIIKEPKQDIEENFDNVCKNLKKEIVTNVLELEKMSPEEIVEDRYKKFRNMGEYINLN